MVWYSHLFQNFPLFVVIHPVKGFGIVNKAEVDVFLELSCFFHDPANVGNLISGSSAFSKSSLNIWKFTVHVLLKPGLEKFEHYFTSVWDECNCGVVWTFFGIVFLWDCNENWSFPAPQLESINSSPLSLHYGSTLTFVHDFCFIDYAKAFDCVDHNKQWKILKEMGIPDHLIFLLRNLYAGQEATVRTGHGTTDWFQKGKGVCLRLYIVTLLI